MQTFYPRTVTIVAANVKAKVIKPYKLTNLGPARRSPQIDIQRHEDRSISLGQLAFTQTTLKLFNIAFVVAALYRSNTWSRTGHMTPARRALRYLNATADLRLRFRSDALAQYAPSQKTKDLSEGNWGMETTKSKYRMLVSLLLAEVLLIQL